jgi:DNA-binding GntR family transcriptional regulator
MAPEEKSILALLLSRSAPLGARVATRELRNEGFSTSEASISRAFTRLDSSGLTVAQGRKGRVLTPVGHRLVTSAIANHRLSLEVSQALDIRSVQQLLDLLRARRGVEREIARAAASRAAPREIEELTELLREHGRLLSAGLSASQCGLDFHLALVRICGSGLLNALADLVLRDSLQPLEQILDVITGGHGTVDQSIPEHAAIVKAVRAHDSATAAEAMDQHLARLIQEAESFSSAGGGGLVERLLRLAR